MAEVICDVEEYFTSLSSINKRILSDLRHLKNSYGNEWDNFSHEDREDLFDKFIIDPAIAEKYSKGTDDSLPEVFPKLKIECGEKIVVDFENDDGWTWRDEHSGPFSWASRSQQDLSMIGLEDDNCKDDKAKKPSRPPRRHRSPDPKTDATKTSWNANNQEMTAADEIFLKFGIQFGANQNDDEEEEEEEETSVPASPTVLNSEESKLLSSSPSKTMTMSSEGSIELQEAASGPVPLDSESPVRKTFDPAAHWKSSDRSLDAGEGLMNNEQTLTIIQDQETEGQLRTSIHLDQIGESSSDPVTVPDPILPSPSSPITNIEAPQVEDDVDFTPGMTKSDSNQSDAPKTGFDFLDNW